MDNGRTVRPAVLFMLNSVSLSAFPSLSQSLSLYLSPCPLHPPLYVLKHPSASTVVETASPQTQTHFFVLPSVSRFFPPLFPFLFLSCSAVTVSVLFRFNLNTFQLCMNQAVINLIMLRHANDTEIAITWVRACICVGIPAPDEVKLLVVILCLK